MGELGARQIEWSSAQLDGGNLSVELSGRSSKGWRLSFESVVALLATGQDEWGKISVRKDSLLVADVRPGSESALRTLLEGAVLQANHDTQPRREPREDAQDAAGGEPDADARMTAAFRAFARGAAGRESEDRAA
jgi:hypothetical protein